MQSNKMIVAAIAMTVAGSAGAAGIGLRAGTTGIGADVAWGLAPTLSARVGYSVGSISTTVTQTDVRYDSDVKLSNLSGLLDWSPLGPFRLTAGLVANNNKVDMTGVAAGGTYVINGVPYNASDIGTLSGTVKTGKSVAPYLGFGYGNVAGAGVNFYFDVGVMFQGSPKVSLTANCGVPACSGLTGDLEAERLRLEDSLSRYKYYPVANFGLTIGF